MVRRPFDSTAAGSAQVPAHGPGQTLARGHDARRACLHWTAAWVALGCVEASLERSDGRIAIREREEDAVELEVQLVCAPLEATAQLVFARAQGGRVQRTTK